MKVVITAQAEADLLAVGEYIRPHNPARAATFIQELLSHCYQLADMPRMYPLVPRYERHSIRRCVHDNYLIFYRVETDRIDIIHILHGARDYEPLLFPDG